jgi:hypothetical protein
LRVVCREAVQIYPCHEGSPDKVRSYYQHTERVGWRRGMLCLEPRGVVARVEVVVLAWCLSKTEAEVDSPVRAIISIRTNLDDEGFLEPRAG